MVLKPYKFGRSFKYSSNGTKQTRTSTLEEPKDQEYVNEAF